MARNADFGCPMDSREAYHIAKSVAKWTWSRFDIEKSDSKFSKLQAFRVGKRWEKKTLLRAQVLEAENDC
jgi:hypothetical protein